MEEATGPLWACIQTLFGVEWLGASFFVVCLFVLFWLKTTNFRHITISKNEEFGHGSASQATIKGLKSLTRTGVGHIHCSCQNSFFLFSFCFFFFSCCKTEGLGSLLAVVVATWTSSTDNSNMAAGFFLRKPAREQEMMSRTEALILEVKMYHLFFIEMQFNTIILSLLKHSI